MIDDVFWTDHLYSILKSNSIRLTQKYLNDFHPAVIKIVECKGGVVKRIDKAVKILKNYPDQEIKKIMRELDMLYNKKEINQKAFLSWEEVKELKKTEIVEFGSHTTHHSILTVENEETAIEELHSSRERLIDEKIVSPSFIPFCYPSGGFNNLLAKEVQKARYNCAVTTVRGWNVPSSDKFTLRRIGVHEDISGVKSLFIARISEGF